MLALIKHLLTCKYTKEEILFFYFFILGDLGYALYTGAENPKADWRSGCDEQDWIKTVFEMPGTASTTGYPQRDPVVEKSAAELTKTETGPLSDIDYNKSIGFQCARHDWHLLIAQ